MREAWRYLLAGVLFLAFVGVALAGGEVSSLPGVIAAAKAAKASSPLCNLALDLTTILLIALVALITIALGGRNLGEFIRGLIKKGGPDLTVNVGAKEAGEEAGKRCPVMAAGGLPVNPELCVAHKAENERSLRNEKHIGELFGKIDDLKDHFNGGVQAISTEIGDMKTEIIKALAGAK